MGKIENTIKRYLALSALRLARGCDERDVARADQPPSRRLLLATILATLVRP